LTRFLETMMRVLFVSSEIYPLVKTGGLADVSAALPKALTALGAEMRLLLPGYPKAIESAANKSVEVELADFMGAGPMRLISARTPDTALPLWLVDCPSLFRRSGGPYQDEHGQDWPDNARRFAVFNHAAARLSLGLLAPDWRADVVHANDWHAGLLPAILAGTSSQRPATVFTIHNLAFQGLFPADVFPQLGLPGEGLMPDGFEFYGKISFLKAGISYSDRLTTVSPTYAREILTAEYGCGLEGLLQLRAKDMVGILNGADYRIWDPATDAHLSANFNLQNIAGKRVCKTALQAELGLDADSEAALVVVLERITEQKMADVVAVALPRIIETGVQCALVGEGDRLLEERLDLAARQLPGSDCGPHRLRGAACTPGSRGRRHLASSGPLRAVRAHAALWDALRRLARRKAHRRALRHHRGCDRLLAPSRYGNRVRVRERERRRYASLPRTGAGAVPAACGLAQGAATRDGSAFRLVGICAPLSRALP
jgi:starch synthase